MTKKQADGLRLSIERFGFAVPFLVSPDGDIYDGHQRKTLMDAIKEYGPNATVDVRVSSRPLTDDERRELVVRLKQNQAGWDFDMLPNLYEREELLEWGFDEAELGMAFVPEFDPVDESTQPRLDQKAPVTCPHCGMEFVPE
jgi:ParB-like chromosome segregation protein Spo0J